VWPYLSDIINVPFVVLTVFFRHDLSIPWPWGSTAFSYKIEKIFSCIIFISCR
jgi:hypothetical protein